MQGGDPLSRDLPEGDRRIGTGGPGYKIKCETAGNQRTHEVGALSMAHAGKDTGGSQFFMVLSESNTRHLNGVHTVFGKVTKGLDVMKQIQPERRHEQGAGGHRVSHPAPGIPLLTSRFLDPAAGSRPSLPAPMLTITRPTPARRSWV